MTILYGIKNCDTVRKARKWLERANIDYRFHDFRDDGIQVSDIQAWLDVVGHKILVNTRSTTWKQLSDAEKDQALGEQSATLLAKTQH